MFCLKCGKQIPDGSGMCPVCGANLIQGGPQYGGMNPQQMGMQGGQQYGQQYGGMNPQQMGMQGGPQYGGMNPQQMGMQGGPQYGGMNPQQMGMQGGPQYGGMNPQQMGMQGGPQYGGMNPQQMGMQGGPQYGGMNPQQMNMQGGQKKAPMDPKKKKTIIIASIIGAILIAGGIIAWILISNHNKKDNDAEVVGDTALSRYVDKSNKADDITAAGTAITALQTALANEDCYDEIMNYTQGKGEKEVIVASIKAAKGDDFTEDNITAVGPKLRRELYMSLSSGMPMKYTEKGAAYFVLTIKDDYMVSVYISTSPDSLDWQIQPNTDPEYR